MFLRKNRGGKKLFVVSFFTTFRKMVLVKLDMGQSWISQFGWLQKSQIYHLMLVSKDSNHWEAQDHKKSEKIWFFKNSKSSSNGSITLKLLSFKWNYFKVRSAYRVPHHIPKISFIDQSWPFQERPNCEFDGMPTAGLQKTMNFYPGILWAFKNLQHQTNPAN